MSGIKVIASVSSDAPTGRRSPAVPLSDQLSTRATHCSRANYGGEPVATAELSADKIAVFAESPAQRRDLNLQIILRDHNSWPHTAQELVFGDQLSLRLQQRQQQIERARSQLYWQAVGYQLPLTQQNPEPAEFERRLRWWWVLGVGGALKAAINCHLGDSVVYSL